MKKVIFCNCVIGILFSEAAASRSSSSTINASEKKYVMCYDDRGATHRFRLSKSLAQTGVLDFLRKTQGLEEVLSDSNISHDSFSTEKKQSNSNISITKQNMENFIEILNKVIEMGKENCCAALLTSNTNAEFLSLLKSFLTLTNASEEVRFPVEEALSSYENYYKEDPYFKSIEKLQKIGPDNSNLLFNFESFRDMALVLVFSNAVSSDTYCNNIFSTWNIALEAIMETNAETFENNEKAILLQLFNRLQTQINKKGI